MKEFGPIHPRDINYHHIRRLRNTITNLKQRTIRTYLKFFAILPTSWISRPLLKSENLSPCDV